MMSSFKLAGSIILKRSFIQYRRVFNTNDCSNLFTRSLVQFHPVVSSRFLNTNGDDHENDRLDSTFEDATGHDVFGRFVKSKSISWYAKRVSLSDSSNAKRIWPTSMTISDDCFALFIEVLGVREEDIKVSIQHQTIVVEGQGDEKFIAEHGFTKFISYIDLHYGIYRISDIKADIKRNSDLLQLSIPKLKQEEIKVLDVKARAIVKKVRKMEFGTRFGMTPEFSRVTMASNNQIVSILATVAKTPQSLCDAVVDLRTSSVKQLADIELLKVKDLRQKAKLRWAAEGEENSQFFHGIINSRRNRSTINGLNIHGDWITDPLTIKDHIFHSFSNRFKESNRSRPRFSSNLFQQIKEEESQLLDRPFTLDEIKEADVVSYVKDFEILGYIPRGCNSSFITLVPKVDDPLVIGDFRPISLIGCQYKIIAKILANRLSQVVASVVGDVQMAYIKGRQIIDGPLMVEEIIAWAKKAKKRLMILKVDFEKAFDSLNWSFLFSILEQMGFSAKWRNWIHSCLNSAYASVLVNGSPTKEFKIKRGLRQGDPLSHFLFILAVEALNVVLLEATNNNWSYSNAKNLSRILTCFHLASGLKVNFNKSKLYGVGVTNDESSSLASTIGCLASQLPCVYLGLPIGVKMSRCHHWNKIVERFQKCLSKWKSKSLSFGRRLTLIKSVLGSLGVYYFSTFKAPKKIISTLETIRRKFFWGGCSEDNKISRIAWDKVIEPCDRGGLGIGSLRTCNQAMLAKWWWRFQTENQALWCKVIRSIHGPTGGLHNNTSLKSNSGPWYHILKLKDDLLGLGINLPSLFKRKLRNDQKISFWHDTWLGGLPLCNMFLRLYHLETNQNYLVYERKPNATHPRSPEAYGSAALVSLSVPQTSTGPMGLVTPHGLNFQWAWSRDVRTSPEIEEFNNLVSLISNLHLTNDEDSWDCTIDHTRKFSVKAMRVHIALMSHTMVSQPSRWNRALSSKININTWRASNRRLPTRINLDRRGVELDSVRCPMCDEDLETKDHIFVSYNIASETWKLILNWWCITNISVNCLHDAICLADQTHFATKKKRLFDVVVQTTLSCLWRFRNHIIFSNKRPSKDLLLNDIKLLSFNWITSRLASHCGGVIPHVPEALVVVRLVGSRRVLSVLREEVRLCFDGEVCSSVWLHSAWVESGAWQSERCGIWPLDVLVVYPGGWTVGGSLNRVRSPNPAQLSGLMKPLGGGLGSLLSDVGRDVLGRVVSASFVLRVTWQPSGLGRYGVIHGCRRAVSSDELFGCSLAFLRMGRTSARLGASLCDAYAYLCVFVGAVLLGLWFVGQAAVELVSWCQGLLCDRYSRVGIWYAPVFTWALQVVCSSSLVVTVRFHPLLGLLTFFELSGVGFVRVAHRRFLVVIRSCWLFGLSLSFSAQPLEGARSCERWGYIPSAERFALKLHSATPSMSLKTESVLRISRIDDWFVVSNGAYSFPSDTKIARTVCSAMVPYLSPDIFPCIFVGSLRVYTEFIVIEDYELRMGAGGFEIVFELVFFCDGALGLLLLSSLGHVILGPHRRMAVSGFVI
ncbi:putative RNA-directed DNA polymerase [Tanacetum coccineum]